MINTFVILMGNIRIDLEDEIHKKLKILAIQEDKKLGELIAQVLRDHVKKNAER